MAHRYRHHHRRPGLPGWPVEIRPVRILRTLLRPLVVPLVAGLTVGWLSVRSRRALAMGAERARSRLERAGHRGSAYLQRAPLRVRLPLRASIALATLLCVRVVDRWIDRGAGAQTPSRGAGRR